MAFEYDNDAVKAWAKDNLADIKSEIDRQGIKHSPKSPNPQSLKNSVTLKTRTRAGIIDRISFGMPRSGIFVHKGVSRGHPISNPRQAKKWFDIPTDKNIGKLQDIIAENDVNYVVNNLEIK